jgi:ribonuclease HI
MWFIVSAALVSVAPSSAIRDRATTTIMKSIKQLLPMVLQFGNLIESFRVRHERNLVRKAIFCGTVKLREKEHESPEAEDETETDAPDNKVHESGRACRQKGWWKRGDVEAKLNIVNMTAWVHKECDIMEEEALTKLQEAWDSSEQKDECVGRLDDLERAYWVGTEVSLLGGYGFQVVTLGADGSCKDGNMGSGCCKFREEGAGKCARVCREEEGKSSNRPELVGVVLALQSAALSEDVLLLYDIEAVLCAIKKWVGQGTQRQTLISAGRATFPIKVKSHRGEPINERADTLAEEGREISDDDKRWDDRTDRMTFEVRKGNTTVLSVWTNIVRNIFPKQAGWAKLQEARAAAAKHWTERVWYCHNQRWLQVLRAGTEASQSGSFKDEQDWGKKCFEDLDQRRMGRPVMLKWSTDFLLREGSSREGWENG